MTSLWRNRDFNLLWSSQSLSDLGGGIASLALSLLVLVETGSPVSAGLVATITQLAWLLFRLPAGVLVDRVDRRRAMVVCDTVRLAVFVALTSAVLTDRASLALILVAAVVDAAAGAVFGTAEDASLRSVVPVDQLPDAVARNEARSYGTSLAGPPLGGLLFGMGHAVPFAANAASFLMSIVALLFIRKPLQAPREDRAQAYGVALAEGLKFVFTHPFLRTLTLIAAPINFAITGVIFTVVVALQQNGTTPAVIGLTETIVGAGGLIGAFAAPAIQRRLGLVALVRAICWTAAVLLAATAAFPSSIAAAIPLGLTVFLGPACTAALFGFQAAITPDRLQGRAISVIMVAATSLAAVAPLLAGVILHWRGPAPAILFFAAAVTGSALIATFGRGLRWTETEPGTPAENHALTPARK